VSGDRIGVLTNSGTFLVKEGALSAQWTDEYNGATAGDVSGDLIGVLTDSGSFPGERGRPERAVDRRIRRRQGGGRVCRHEHDAGCVSGF